MFKASEYIFQIYSPRKKVCTVHQPVELTLSILLSYFCNTTFGNEQLVRVFHIYMNSAIDNLLSFSVQVVPALRFVLASNVHKLLLADGNLAENLPHHAGEKL